MRLCSSPVFIPLMPSMVNTTSTISAIAKAITGAHWNGWLFFGLTRQKRAV